MQYRKLGGINWKASILGFGCMRFPTIDGQIDEEKSTAMLHHAIDQGVNYLDTGYPYHNGQSEAFLGRVLKGGYREQVKVATKMPSWEINTAADFDRFLDEQMRRLDMDHLDIYLLHALNGEYWPKLRDLGVLDWAERAKADGRFDYFGFSFHDNYPAFQEIIDDYDSWDLCQIQYNLIDIENQAGQKGLQYAASKGLGVVIMEPLLGAKLVNPPPPVRDLWASAPVQRSPVEWALQWVWNQPEVSVILSGMGAMDQVQQNISFAETSRVGLLDDVGQDLFDQVRAAYQARVPIPCTGCEYCMPCPNNVDIPSNIGVYNEGVMYDNPDGARGQYDWMYQAYAVHGIKPNDTRAELCIQCGLCDEKCPQQIPISSWMPIIHKVLGQGEPFRNNL